MTSNDVNSRIRSHRRQECDVHGEIRVSERDAASVVLASSQLTASGAVAVNIFDVSEGGLGLRTNVFLPKGCAINIRVRCPDRNASGTFERPAEVKRITMIDSLPTYELGVAFSGECTGDAGMDQLEAWAAASTSTTDLPSIREAAA